MNTPLRNIAEAAEYTGVPELFLINLIKNGGGPKYIVPGKRRRFFIQEDLDEWIQGWRKREMPKPEPGWVRLELDEQTAQKIAASLLNAKQDKDI